MIVTERQMKLWLTEEGIAGMIERQCIKHVLQADAIVGPCLFHSIRRRLGGDGAVPYCRWRHFLMTTPDISRSTGARAASGCG